MVDCQPYCPYSLSEYSKEEYLQIFSRFLIKKNSIMIESILNKPDQLSHYSLLIE